jgi:hypothetical protein
VGGEEVKRHRSSWGELKMDLEVSIPSMILLKPHCLSLE